MKTLFKLAGLLVVAIICYFSGEPETFLLIAHITPLWYDRSGYPIYTPEQAARNLGSTGGAPSPDAASAVANCICGDNRNYIVPSSFTLQFPGAAGATVGKAFSFDNVAEAISGQLGTVFPVVQEFPNGNGTVALQDGTFIFGNDALKNITTTYAIVVKGITATGVAIAGLPNLQLTFLKGNISSVGRESRDLILNQANASAIATLINGDIWYLTANKLMNVPIAAGVAAVALTLRFDIAGYKPYTELL